MDGDTNFFFIRLLVLHFLNRTQEFPLLRKEEYIAFTIDE